MECDRAGQRQVGSVVVISRILLVGGLPLLMLAGCGGGSNNSNDSRKAAESKDEEKIGANGKAAGKSSSSDANSKADSKQAAKADKSSTSAATTAATTQRESWRKYAVVLTSKDLAKKSEAQQFLDKLSPDELKAATDFLLVDQDAAIRTGTAFYLLGKLGDIDEQTKKQLYGLLADKDAKVRHVAIRAVQRGETRTKLAHLDQLRNIVSSDAEELNNRLAAIRLIGSLTQQAKSALPELTNAFTSDGNPKVQKASLAAIYQIATPRDSAKILLKVLTDKNAPISVQRLAVVRLGNLGVASKQVVTVLGSLLAHADKELADAAAESLNRLGPGGIPELVRQLSSSSVDARRRAVMTLGLMGAEARGQLNEIRKRLSDPDKKVQELARDAIQQISPM